MCVVFFIYLDLFGRIAMYEFFHVVPALAVSVVGTVQWAHIELESGNGIVPVFCTVHWCCVWIQFIAPDVDKVHYLRVP
jgi:hypothetical protein